MVPPSDTTRLYPILCCLLLLVAGRAVAQTDSSFLPVNLGHQVNSNFDEVLPVIAPDGRTIYYDRTNHPLNLGKDDIWYSVLQSDSVWSTPLASVLANVASTTQPRRRSA